MTRDSQFRNGYLARDQNLPRSNFFAGLKIAMEGKYDVHCKRLWKMWRPIIERRCLMPWFSFFRRIAQGVKQNNLDPFIVLFMGLGDTSNLRRDLANQAWSVEILLMTSDKSDKINTQDWGWNITVDTVGLLSIMRQVFIFILKCIVYAAFCGLIWLLQGWRSRKLVDDTAWTTQIWRVCFVRKD